MMLYFNEYYFDEFKVDGSTQKTHVSEFLAASLMFVINLFGNVYVVRKHAHQSIIHLIPT